MKKHFYHNIIEVESLVVELDKLDFSPEEKLHLAQLVDANIHNTVLDAILSELSEEDKRHFLEHLSEDNHEKIWSLLHNKVENIEDKIKKAAEDLKTELHQDIKEAKTKK